MQYEMKDGHAVWVHEDLPEPDYRVTITVERIDGRAIEQKEAEKAATKALQLFPMRY